MSEAQTAPIHLAKQPKENILMMNYPAKYCKAQIAATNQARIPTE